MRDGSCTTVDCNRKREATEILDEIVARVPWIVAGYHGKLERLWEDNPVQFIAAVDEQRSIITQQAEANSPAEHTQQAPMRSA